MNDCSILGTGVGTGRCGGGTRRILERKASKWAGGVKWPAVGGGDALVTKEGTKRNKSIAHPLYTSVGRF
jgi:hypothetical protein